MKTSLDMKQRPLLMGRMRMAAWLEMPEKEFAREIQNIERNPLFLKLHFGEAQYPGVIRRQRWPRADFSGGFYEINEKVTAGRGERVRVEELLEQGPDLMPKIRKMGQEAFERYFLYAEEALPLEEIARRTGLSMEEIGRINELLLKIGAEAEFAAPEKTPDRRQSCLARVYIEEDEPRFEFFSPYWARGLYHIRYDLLERWKESGRLKGAELRKLPRFLKRLETVNLRQSTMFRVLESLSRLQSDFIFSKRPEAKRPISLRMLSRRLDLAPSTVSRAAAGRSVLMPWGEEVQLIELMPGRRRVVRDILSVWIKENPKQTDSALAERLKLEYGIKIARRTVNAARGQIGPSNS
ncbi:MAG: hypothetical protein KGL04_03320 [Elusimicrobia bacterium]|nr:hypothetical protein [Elusimicrobiota bacterium]